MKASNTARRAAFALLLAFVTLLVARAALASVEIEFASVADARAVLGARDAFVARLSPFDRAARLQVGRDVSEREYLAFVRDAALAWMPEERARVEAAFHEIEPALSALLPTFDEPILLIKTTGAEEGGASAYTRGSAVMLTESAIRSRSLARTLAHEVFHVVSRHDPELRRELYAVIGFDYCGEVAHPERLAARRITNPDAPVNDHCILLDVDGAEAWAVPILFSRETRFEPAAGRALLDYLTLEFLLVDRSDGPARPRPILRDDGRPALVPIDRVSGFFEQVGWNTSYVIHPEEILASNFAMLVLGETNRPSPEVLEEIRRVMTARKAAASALSARSAAPYAAQPRS